MINSELFVEIKAIVLRKIQQQFKEAHFYEHPVFGLCSVIEDNINWQHSVAQMFPFMPFLSVEILESLKTI